MGRPKADESLDNLFRVNYYGVWQYSGDLVTYLNETYLAFFTGDKPMSEWDAYIDGCNVCGMDKILEIYQNAYDNYMATK